MNPHGIEWMGFAFGGAVVIALTVVVGRALFAESATQAKITSALRRGTPARAVIETMGRSPVEWTHPPKTIPMRVELRLEEATADVATGTPLVVDQTIPELALGALTPRASVAVRVLVVDGVVQAAIDLRALGYR